MATESDNQTTAPASSTQAGVPKPVGSPAPRVDRVDHASGRSSVGIDGPTDGKTTIAEGVVSKVAGIAARAVPGVHALGGGGARAIGAVREAFTSTDLSQGVKVEVGETQAAVDLTLVVEYPQPIQDVCDNVRASVATAITNLVGLEVVEVNIVVNDVFLPGDDNNNEESRVS